MTAAQQTDTLLRHLHARGIPATFAQANTLRRAEITLQHWAEAECGNSNEYGSWSIERDEDTGIPYMVRQYYPRNWHTKDWTITRTRTPDREAGALRRVQAVCAALGIHYYHQTDPRGCALYVDPEPLPENNYTIGVACCA